MLSGQSSYDHQGAYILRNSAQKQISTREVKTNLANNKSKTDKNLFTVYIEMSGQDGSIRSCVMRNADSLYCHQPRKVERSV